MQSHSIKVLSYQSWRLFLGALILGVLLASAATPAQAAGTVTVPTDLNPGDQYRLAFVTDETFDASSSNINDYNVFVTAQAGKSTELAALGTNWTVIGSTASVDARDNTQTNTTSDGIGVPIYLLNDVRIANNNNDLWDGSIANPLSVDQYGTAGIADDHIATGTYRDGTASGLNGIYALGKSFIETGNSAATSQEWTWRDSSTNGHTRRLYAISDVLTVPTPLRFTIEPPTVQTAPVTDAICSGNIVRDDFDDLADSSPAQLDRAIGRYAGFIDIFTKDDVGGADIPSSAADTRYISAETTGGSYTLDFTAAGPGPVGYFGFWWSAGDGYNILEVTRVDGTVETFTTQSIINSPALQGSPNCSDAGAATCHFGNPTSLFMGQNPAEAYAFVNIYAQDAASKISSIRFTETGGGGFESDNHTICTALIPRNQQGGAALGGIVIKKETGPAGATGFQFTDDIEAPNSFSLNDGEEKPFLDVATGIYEVTEDDPGSAPGGFSLVDLACVDGDANGVASSVDLGARKATIHLDPNETVTCTFTNEGPREYGDAPDSYGTTNAANGAYHFFTNDLFMGFFVDFEADGIPTAGADGDDLDNVDDEDALATLPDLVSTATSYTLSNIQVENHTGGDVTLYGWLDDNGNGQFEAAERASVTVVNGVNPATLTWGLTGAATVGQSYVRLRLSDQTGLTAVGPGGIGEVEDHPLEIIDTGTIIIKKQTAPAGGALFIFGDDIEAPNNFTLDDGQSKTFANVSPGTYAVNEVVPNNYKLTDLRCDDSGSATPSTGDLGSATATINLDPGETVTCTFINSQDDAIVVRKVTIPAGGTGFDFTDDIEAPNSFSLNDGDLKAFANVTPFSTHTITEIDPGSTYDITGIMCNVSDGTTVAGDINTGSVTLDLTGSAGLAATCTFTNTARSTLIIAKETLPDGDPQKFDFIANGPVAGPSVPPIGDGESAVLENLQPGSWTIQEAVPNPPWPWTVTDVKCKSATGASKSTPNVGFASAAVELAPGDTVTCTFTNSKDDHLTINKVTVPAGGQGFGFTVANTNDNSPFALDDGGSESREFIPSQTAVVIEDDPAAHGYALTDITCEDNQGNTSYTIDVDARSVEVGGDAGLVASCTYTNTQLGGIIIEKVTEPALTDSFTFIAPLDPFLFALGNGDTQQFHNVLPGRYRVTEASQPAGVRLADIRCDDGNSPTPSVTVVPDGDAIVNVDPGEIVRCTFTNVAYDTVIIEKRTLPAGDASTSFGFSGNLPTAGSFSLMDGDAITDTAVTPDQTYYVEEGDPAGDGYELVDITCHDTNTGQTFHGDLTTRRVDFTPEAGHTIYCTFTNQAKGRIVVHKEILPTGSSEVFSFTNSIDSPALFNLGNGDSSREFLDVTAGQYTVEELPSSTDYRLSAIVCTDSDGSGTPSTGDPATRRATINVDPGETVECTFTNAENDTVLVQKFTDPPGGTGFGFDTTFDPTDDSFTLDDTQTQVIPGVTSGQPHTVTENDPTPAYDLVEALCFDTFSGAVFSGDLAARAVTFTPAAGHVIYCGFLNQERGSVTIAKETTPAGSADFGFTLSGQGQTTSETVNAGSSTTVNDLVPGAYTLVEDDPASAGFKLTGIECLDSGGQSVGTANTDTRTANIQVGAGENVTCTFANLELGEIRIRKTVESGPTGPFAFLHNIDGSFNFQLNGGDVASFGNVMPGPYSVSELITPDGSGLKNIVCDDNTSATPSTVDVTNGLATINVDPGETVECEFINAEAKVQIIESYTVSRVEEGKVTGHGSIACYWITLATAPYGGSVTVAVGPPANSQVTLSKSRVTLDASNWNSLTTSERSNFVCIRPIDDQIDESGPQICRNGNDDIIGNGSEIVDKECGDHTGAIPHDITSASVPGYTTTTGFERKQPNTTFIAAPGGQIDVLVQDNDSAGVILTESYGVSDLDEDGAPVNKACYWVTLETQPTASVKITPQPDSQVRVNPSELNLNASNWNALGAESNKICIFPEQDPQVEGTPNQFCADKKVDLFGTGAVAGQVCGSHLGAVGHAISSGDGNYNDPDVPVSGNGPEFNNTGPRVIDVLIRDDDRIGVGFNAAAVNALEGQPATYQTRLLSQPNADVTLRVRTNSLQAAGVDSTQLTFTPQNWDVEQTVTLALANDDVANGPRTLPVRHELSSADSRFNGVVDDSMTIHVVDDDSPGVILLTSAVSAGEDGTTGSYGLRLTSRPLASVTVDISGDNQANPDRSSLTLTPDMWDQVQNVVVSAVDDAVAESDGNGLLLHIVRSDDAGYNGVAVGTMPVLITDNDVAGLIVDGLSQTVVGEGDSTTYRVALRSQPANSVQVLIAGDGRTQVSPAVLNFDAGNWATAQTVTLTAVDDVVDNRPNQRPAQVNHVAAGDDVMYDGLIAESLLLAIQDDDVAAVQLSVRNLDLGTGQQGGYTVALATEPTGDVLVELAPGDSVVVGDTGCATEESGTPCLLFTTQNWQVGQQVSVTSDSDGLSSVDHRASSNDPGYDELGSRLTVNGDGSQPTAKDSLFLPLISR